MSQTAPPAAAPTTSSRVVMRTLVRPDLEMDVRPLYFTGVTSFAAQGVTDLSRAHVAGAESGEASLDAGAVTTGAHVQADGSTRVESGRRISFATYFNAFPAAYWRRWSVADAVTLTATLSGRGSLVVYRSTARGHVIRESTHKVHSAEPVDVTVELSLAPFIDGGWYWFEVEAGEDELVLHDSAWSVPTDRTTPGTASLGMTTFNRADYCVKVLLQLAESPEVLEVLDQVIVVDQGTRKVADEPAFPRAAEALGDKLRIIDQPNLGGSGGFSRAMLETLADGRSDYVLLMDDDVELEPHGILRATTFADLAREPILVGGHMFSLHAPSLVHSMGEAMEPAYWRWNAAPGTVRGHDFCASSLRATPWMHRRIDVDFNAWWMCLVPVQVVREIGLSMPMFVKWDDVEYGIRAGKAGYPTVSFPGAAVWHVPWTEKEDLDWQAYFLQRNRLASALVHSDHPRGGKLLQLSFMLITMHLAMMRYSVADTMLLAMEDVLDGPERMHRDMVHRLGEVRARRAAYDDAQASPQVDAYPPASGGVARDPRGKVGRMGVLAKGMARQLRAPRPDATRQPEAVVAAPDVRWWRLIQHDSVVVSSVDGATATWFKRDPRAFRELTQRSIALHKRLHREWPELSRRYRAALADLTSAEAWQTDFRGERSPDC